MNSRALRLNKGTEKIALTLVGLKPCDSKSGARVLTMTGEQAGESVEGNMYM